MLENMFVKVHVEAVDKCQDHIHEPPKVCRVVQNILIMVQPSYVGVCIDKMRMVNSWNELMNMDRVVVLRCVYLDGIWACQTAAA